MVLKVIYEVTGVSIPDTPEDTLLFMFNIAQSTYKQSLIHRFLQAAKTVTLWHWQSTDLPSQE